MLNPETNSDSDSLKSNGARCVSAKVQITHKGRRGINAREDTTNELRIEKDNIKTVTRTIRVLKTASYEMDCATERRLPIREYLELDDQPASKTEKTITELTQKNMTRE